MRTFLVLVRKELRELVTPQIFAPLLAVVLIFMVLGNVIGSAQEETAGARVLVIDNDSTTLSAAVASSLKAAGLEVTVRGSEDTEATIAEETGKGTALFVLVPDGFAATLEAGRPATVGVRTVMKDFSIIGTRGGTELQVGLAKAGQAIATAIAAKQAPGVSADLLRQPLTVKESVTVGTRTADTSAAAVSAFISQQTVFIPIVLFMVVVFAAQLIGTTIAAEKENKTLETLLSYPISRTSLVTAKMVAAGLVSLVAAGVYMVGMQEYMSGVEAGFGGSAGAGAAASQELMRQLGLVLGPADYVMLGLSLFAGILLALSIAIILGAFAESVKAVGALITPLMVLLLVPYLLTMFVNLDSASPVLKWVVLAIPFTHAFTAAQNLFLGADIAVWAGIGYQLAWFVVFALVAARIFSSDRILTMKLAARRSRSSR